MDLPASGINLNGDALAGAEVLVGAALEASDLPNANPNGEVVDCCELIDGAESIGVGPIVPDVRPSPPTLE